LTFSGVVLGLVRSSKYGLISARTTAPTRTAYLTVPMLALPPLISPNPTGIV